MAQNPKRLTTTMAELKASIDLTKILSLISTLPKRELAELTEEWLTYADTINQQITLKNLREGNDIPLRLLSSTKEGRQFISNFLQFPEDPRITKFDWE